MCCYTDYRFKLCYGIEPPSPQSGSAESEISGKLHKTTMARERTTRVHFTFTNVDKM